MNETDKKERITLKYKGKEYELIGVKAMLRPVEGGKMIWANVSIDTLVLQAAMKGTNDSKRH